MLYIHFQDFASAIVGPFEDQDFVDVHIKFCRQRGDSAAVLEIADESRIDELRAELMVMVDGKVVPGFIEMTPEEDRAQDFTQFTCPMSSNGYE